MRRLTVVILFLLCVVGGCGPDTNLTYRKIIRLVQDGTLLPDSHGVVYLTSNLRYATVKGILLVFKKRVGSETVTIIIFPTRMEGRDNFYGYLYCSKPLKDSEMTNNNPEIIINENEDRFIAKDHMRISLGSVFVKKRFNASWCYIGNFKDSFHSD